MAFDRSTATICLLFPLCALPVSTARAQVPIDRPEHQAARESRDPPGPRMEMGAQGGLLVSLTNEGVTFAGAGAHVTVNVTRRDAVELVADLVAGSDQIGVNGRYFLQYKGVLREGTPQRNAVFWTAAAGGAFRYVRSSERRAERVDGSTVINPPYSHAELTRPFVLGAGIGVERVLARYVAFRAEVQALVPSYAFVGIRGEIGMSIPLGGYHVEHR